ncbi:MAG: nuclear transport factor 2 family protein [Acidobacteriota bacterium]
MTRFHGMALLLASLICLAGVSNAQTVCGKSLSTIDCVAAQLEIQNLVAQMLIYYDHQDYDHMMALFTEDAYYSSPTRGDHKGRADIRKAMADRPATRLTRHIVSNLVLNVLDATNAEGSSYVTGYLSDQGWPFKKEVPQEGPPAVGDYRFKFKKVGGAWKISEKITQPVFSGIILK